MKRIFAFVFVFVIMLSLTVIPVCAYTADDGAGNLTENGTEPDTSVNAEGDYINLICGQTELSGNVGGDVIGVFSSFVSDGLTVGGSMRFIAVQAELKNTSCRNLTFLCGDVSVGEEVNAGAVYIFATGTVYFSGSCDVLVVRASDVVISGEVKSTAKIYADNVTLSSDAALAEVIVESTGKPVLSGSSGDALTHFKDVLTWKEVNVWKEALVSLPSVIAYAVSGALLVQLVFGRSTKDSAGMFKARPFRFLLSGFMLLISLPGFAVFMLMLSTEIATALLLVYLALMVVSQLFAGSVLGARFFPTMNRFLSAVIVTTTVAVICSLPYVGSLVSMLCMLVAFGYFGTAAMSKMFSHRKAAGPEIKE